MATNAKRREADDLAAKVRSCLKARDKGKALYAAADLILDELLAELEPGQIVDLGRGRKAQLVDNFAGGKNKVFRAHGIARFELREVA